MIEAHELTVKLGGNTVLDRVSLNVGPGEFLGLLGPNGAGKSTLLKTLTGERKPNAGRVTLGGNPLPAMNRTELARRRAVLSQHPEVPGGYTVRDLVALGRTPHRGSFRDAQAVDGALEAAGVGDLAHRWLMSLSGGEVQRAQFARVLAQLDPEAGEGRWLFLDEPTSSLDLAYQHTLLEAVRGLTALGVTVVAVLHDLNLAAHYCDRLMLLASGKVLADGAPTDTLTPQLLGRAFGTAVSVTQHPGHGGPLVVPLGLLNTRTKENKEKTQ